MKNEPPILEAYYRQRNKVMWTFVGTGLVLSFLNIYCHIFRDGLIAYEIVLMSIVTIVFIFAVISLLHGMISKRIVLQIWPDRIDYYRYEFRKTPVVYMFEDIRSARLDMDGIGSDMVVLEFKDGRKPAIINVGMCSEEASAVFRTIMEQIR